MTMTFFFVNYWPGQKNLFIGGKPLGVVIFNDFDELLKAFQALYATEQCFFFVKSLLKVCLFGVPVILLMLTAETLMLDNSSKCFSDSF